MLGKSLCEKFLRAGVALPEHQAHAAWLLSTFPAPQRRQEGASATGFCLARDQKRSAPLGAGAVPEPPVLSGLRGSAVNQPAGFVPALRRFSTLLVFPRRAAPVATRSLGKKEQEAKTSGAPRAGRLQGEAGCPCGAGWRLLSPLSRPHRRWELRDTSNLGEVCR